MTYLVVMELELDGHHPDEVTERDVRHYVSDSLDSTGVTVTITDVNKKEDE